MNPPNSQSQTQTRGQSEVLSVALLIAIVVILAGVIGFLVLGVDIDGTNTPNAQLTFSQSTNGSSYDVTVVHEGGDRLLAENTEVVITNNDGDAVDIAVSNETLTSGDSLTVAKAVEPNDEVRIVWDDPNSDQTHILGEYRVD